MSELIIPFKNKVCKAQTQVMSVLANNSPSKTKYGRANNSPSKTRYVKANNFLQTQGMSELISPL